MNGSGGISARQVLGGVCIGFGVAVYLFGALALAFVWMSRMFVFGVSNRLILFVVMLMPAVLMLIGILSILKSRKTG